ncbi:hypothetical protein BZL30_2410 [Mycobacterium kansasii]|uniref:Uncharacterized protein n=1 Tax=Mycobacterium kansasii TaxID=1768 RepID=A0A1V3XIV0_MYCKA|nr:hypothetical protein BZL30_2410 [Mycobacterium kansasii]
MAADTSSAADGTTPVVAATAAVLAVLSVARYPPDPLRPRPISPVLLPNTTSSLLPGQQTNGRLSHRPIAQLCVVNKLARGRYTEMAISTTD